MLSNFSLEAEGSIILGFVGYKKILDVDIFILMFMEMNDLPWYSEWLLGTVYHPGEFIP